MVEAKDLLFELSTFIGSGEYYRHFMGVQYTEGVKYLAERAGAYWLIDLIASYQIHPAIKDNEDLQDFQIWHLKKTTEDSAVITLLRDSDQEVLSQVVDCTDFPLDELKLYCCSGMILLPSEY